MKRRSISLAVLAAIAIAAMAPSAARAHELSFQCTQIGEVVDILASYEGDIPCQHGLVRIEQGKRLIASGKTDDRGRCSLPRPAPGKYRVTVNDGAGHFAEAPMTVRPPATEDPSVEPTPVVEGSSRFAFLGNRWAGLAIGLAAIAVLTVAARALLRRSS